MKIQNGKIKLSKRDRQIGNFIVTSEDEHYKIQAINQHWGLRVAKDTVIGKLCSEGLSGDNYEGFGRIIAYLYTVSSTIGDMDSIKAIVDVISGAQKRQSIKNGNPSLVYSSAEELIDTVLGSLQANNVWLSEEDVVKVGDMLRINYEANRNTYNPAELEKISELASEEERLKHEEISRLAQQEEEK